MAKLEPSKKPRILLRKQQFAPPSVGGFRQMGKKKLAKAQKRKKALVWWTAPVFVVVTLCALVLAVMRSRAAAADLRAQSVASFRRGEASLRADDNAAARKLFEEAIVLDGHNDNAHFAMAQLATQENRFEEAVAAIRAVTAYRPSSESAWMNLHALYYNARKDREAYDTLVEVVRINPRRMDTLLRLGDTAMNVYADAAQCREYLAQAEALAPASAFLRLRNALIVPPIFDSDAQLREYRGALEGAAREAAAGDEGGRAALAKLANLDHTTLPSLFYLVYHGRNDRELMRDVQAALARAFPVLSSTAPHLLLPPSAGSSTAPPGGPRVRVGFISRFWNRAAVAKLFGGIVSRLPRERFEVIVFAPDEAAGKNADMRDDPLAPTLQSLGASAGVRVVTVKKAFAVGNRAVAHREKLDVAVFCSVGMDMGELTWAHGRLAPVQIATWGHPQTTGLHTIDYFVASDLFVNRRQQRGGAGPGHFSEQLVRFKSLGFFFQQPTVPRAIAAEANAKKHDMSTMVDKVPPGAPTYMIPQSLVKLHHSLDGVLQQLLQLSPKAYVLIGASKLSDAWRQRLAARMRRVVGAEHMDRVLFLPRMRTVDFWRIMAMADVIIDPYTTSASVNTVEALAMCKIVVTLPKLQSTLAFAAGMYRRIGLRALIATDEHDFVQTAHRLLINKGYRANVERDICDANKVLFEDQAAVDEWSDFLWRVGGREQADRGAAAAAEAEAPNAESAASEPISFGAQSS